METKQQLIRFHFIWVKSKNIGNGNNDEGDDEYTPKTNLDSNYATEEGLWVDFAISSGRQSNDSVPNSILEIIKILSRSFR